MDHKFIILNVYANNDSLFQFSFQWKYLCIMDVFLVLKLDIVVLHVHHPCGCRENLEVIKMIMVVFQFHCN